MKIKELNIKNFKGIEDYKLVINEENNITSIKGKNGSGKSSIKKAFFWCLGAEVGDVIPCKDNKEIPNLEIEVELKMKIEDVEYSLRRVQKEKYKTDKETMQQVKTGNASIYYIDNIECLQTEYKEKIANILGISKYNKLLMLTELEHFNTTMKWQDRREELFNHVASDNNLLSEEKYNSIREDVSKGTPLPAIKKSYNDLIKKIKEEKLSTASRIDILDKQMKEATSQSSKEALEKKVNEAVGECDKLVEETTKYNKILHEYNCLINDIEKYGRVINDAEENKKILNDKMEKSIKEYESIIKQAQDNSQKCPYCNSIIDEEKNQKIVEMLQEKIKTEQNNSFESQERIQKQIDDFTNKLNEKQSLLEMFNASYNLEDIKNKVNNSSLVQVANERVNKARSELYLYNKAQENLITIEAERKHLIDLTEREIKEINKLKALNEYTLETSKLINSQVNALFEDGIEFALFDFANYKGDITDICLAMYNGKNYDECSTGEKYMLNFYLINKFQELYKVDLPIFCDNYECLSTPLQTNRQLITFEVSTNEIENLKKI